MAYSWIKAVFLGCAVMASVFAFSQDSEQETKEPVIEEIIEVWGTEVRASSIKLEDEAIAVKQPDHMSDLLRTVPGVDVGGAHSLNQRITIRSMDDKDLRISIDGASQNSYMYHHMGNLQIHADILKSVEIDVGANSVRYGGLGGGVRFETKTAKELLAGETLGARVLGSYGDNNSDGFSLAGYGRLGKSFDFLVYHNAIDRANYEVGGGTITDASGVTIPGTDGEVRGHEGSVEDSLIKLGWDFGQNNRLSLGFEHYDDSGDYSYRPDMGLATDLAISENLGLPLTYPTEFQRETLTLNYEAFLGGATNLQATAYQNQSTLMRNESGVAAVFGGSSLIEGGAENTGLNMIFTTLVGNRVTHQLTYGVETVLYETQYITDRRLASEEEQRNTAVFIENKIEWGERFTITPGIRYENSDLDSNLIQDNFGKFTMGLSGQVQLSDNIQASVGGVQIFKAPEIGEVFIGAGLRDTPNQDIREENGINTEVGLNYLGDQHKNGRWSAGLTLFKTEIDNYIYDYASRSDGSRGKDNVGDMSIEGLEAFVGFDFGNFNTLLSFSSAESELTAFGAYSNLDGARLDRQQGDDISFNLDYKLANRDLTLHWDSLNVASVDAALDLDGASKDNSKDSYFVNNISIRWTPKRFDGLGLTFGIDNVFDEYYASQSSRTGLSAHPRFGDLYLVDYEPGRNIKTTLSYRF